jgi:hypothetical protein
MQRKTYEKIQHPFIIKTLVKIGIEEMYLNILKAIYDKLIANIMLNGEKVKPFPLKSRRRQRCPLFPLLFNSLGILSQSNNTGRRKKGNWKGSSQTILICS